VSPKSLPPLVVELLGEELSGKRELLIDKAVGEGVWGDPTGWYGSGEENNCWDGDGILSAALLSCV